MIIPRILKNLGLHVNKKMKNVKATQKLPVFSKAIISGFVIIKFSPNRSCNVVKGYIFARDDLVVGYTCLSDGFYA